MERRMPTSRPYRLRLHVVAYTASRPRQPRELLRHGECCVSRHSRTTAKAAVIGWVVRSAYGASATVVTTANVMIGYVMSCEEDHHGKKRENRRRRRVTRWHGALLSGQYVTGHHCWLWQQKNMATLTPLLAANVIWYTPLAVCRSHDEW